jgi:molybdopterin/thiamine biosynthesis adenylyltransferase
MRYSLTLLEDDFERLVAAVFSSPGNEGAAYLLCGRSVTSQEDRLLCREVVPVADQHYVVRAPDRLSIDSLSYAAIAKRAAALGDSIVFVHSHPDGVETFSQQDDREEPRLMEFLDSRAPSGGHGSLVLTSTPTVRGRVWRSGNWLRMDRVRVMGRRFAFFDSAMGATVSAVFDRQVRAFGPDLQRLLGALHVGVVGAGGTGSAVIEQLARLGVGTLTVFDGDDFDVTNVNRVYGSKIGDKGKNKARIAADHVDALGLGTHVRPIDKHISVEAAARELRDCDLVFGCTDTHSSRALLVQLAIRYLIAVFDLGVKVDARDGVINGVFGRVTTLYPGEACLFCRGRVDPHVIALEALSPSERRARVDEEYAPDIDIPDPAVVSFTTAVAAQAVAECLHRLTSFMGADRQSSEVLLMAHETSWRRNRESPKSACGVCSRKNWATGDRGANYLGVTWPSS